MQVLSVGQHILCSQPFCILFLPSLQEGKTILRFKPIFAVPNTFCTPFVVPKPAPSPTANGKHKFESDSFLEFCLLGYGFTFSWLLHPGLVAVVSSLSL